MIGDKWIDGTAPVKDEDIPDFILEWRHNDLKLVRIQEGTKLISLRNTTCDVPLYRRMTSNIQYKNNCLQIDFIANPKSGRLPIREMAEQLRTQQKEPDLFLDSKNYREITLYKGLSAAEESFLFQITYTDPEEKRTYAGAVRFHIAKPTNIYEAVFDFGSEASQMCYKKVSERDNPARVSIFSRMRETFYNPAFEDKLKVADKYFYQYDKDDPELFLSRFFVMLDESEFNPHRTPIEKPFHDGLKSLVKLLSITNDRAFPSHQLLANLKLSEIGNINRFNIRPNNRSITFRKMRDDIFRIILNQFLHTLLQDICDHEFVFERHKDQANKLRLTLLVPNIYHQQQASSLIHSLRQDAWEIIQQYRSEYTVDAIEVQVMSESDASFLGLFRVEEKLKKLKANANYLVIDTGKGTTDLSIIRVGSSDDSMAAYQFSNIYRNGFAGAGNVLTYAFIETIAALVVGPRKQDRQQFIQQVFFNYLTKDGDWQATDNKDQLAFIDFVEGIKKRFSNGVPYELADLKKLHSRTNEQDRFMHNPEIKLEILNELLEAHFDKSGRTIADYYGIIDQAVNQVVEQIITMVHRSGEKEFHGVLLTGRSFLFQPLRDRLAQRLKESFKITNIDGIEDNRVLFFGRSSKIACLYGPYNATQGVGRNANLIGMPIFENNIVDAVLPKRLRKFFGLKDNNTQRKAADIGADILSDDFFLNGFNIDTPQIEGMKWKNPISSRSGEYNVFFTGREFIIRSDSGVSEAEPLNKAKDDPATNELLWKSLFPHIPSKTFYLTNITKEKITEVEQVLNPTVPKIEETPPSYPSNTPAPKTTKPTSGQSTDSKDWKQDLLDEYF